MAQDPVETTDAAAVRVFPPAIPLFVMIAGAILERLWPLNFGPPLPTPQRYWLGALIVAAALLGLGYPALRRFRGGGHGQTENPWKPTTHILTEGPFRLTRNPMYLQMVLVPIGVAVAFANWWIAALTPLNVWALYQLAIRPEEAYLEEKFGETYLAYKRRVRRWI